MKSKEVCDKYGITRLTLSSWVKKGHIKFELLPSGRYNYLPKEDTKKDLENRVNVVYSRVSTTIQKENLARQTQRIKEYCSAKGVIVDEVFSDIGSALNYGRRGYLKLFDLVISRKVAKIFLEYKDRILRIGFEDFERLCKAFGTEIVVIDKSEKDKDKQKEITEDLVSIIHHFSMRIYSSRKRKKVIEAIKS